MTDQAIEQENQTDGVLVGVFPGNRAGAQVWHLAGKQCSDERPCIPCFTDRGPCEG